MTPPLLRVAAAAATTSAAAPIATSLAAEGGGSAFGTACGDGGGGGRRATSWLGGRGWPRSRRSRMQPMLRMYVVMRPRRAEGDNGRQRLRRADVDEREEARQRQRHEDGVQRDSQAWQNLLKKPLALTSLTQPEWFGGN